MHIFEALDYVKQKVTDSKISQERYTLEAIYRLIAQACLDNAAKWSKNIEQTVAYIESGHYAGTDQDARKILNRRLRRKQHEQADKSPD